MSNLEMSKQVDPVPDKWAVLIGIECYKHPEQPTTTPRYDGRGNNIEYKNLRGCVNDVLAVEQYLVDTIKVDPTQITKLLAPYPGRQYLSQLPASSYCEPTYDNIVNALKVPESAKKGDFVYIHFSGHGARATTVFPELKHGGADAEDQALVPSDITRGGKYLRDLEMGVLLQEMVDAGLVVTVVLDCCHSGGAVRGDDDPELGDIRGISDIYKSNLELDQPKANSRIMDLGSQKSWMDAPKGFVVLAACEEHQKAAEIPVNGNSHGLLTYWLLTILRNSPLDFSSQTLYEQVCAKVQDRNRNQTPYLVGDKDRFFFSKKLRSRVYALKVRKAAVDTRKDLEDRWVHLAGGILHGVVEGSEYAILPLNFDLNKQVEATDVLARVQVTKVMTGQSITAFTRADEKSTVHFVTPDDSMKANFEKDWHQKNGSQTWLSLNREDNRDPFFTISIDDNGIFKISDRAGNFTAAIKNAVRPLPAAAAAVQNDNGIDQFNCAALGS
ncbi:hypothetical protein MKX08_007199 [Trichoderma sp. CBMAI-0020]|nr:hypothetical protein MKX08_007199 [Trichoderma sp. CBMAI-0020]